MKHVNLDDCDEAVKNFVLSFALTPGGAALELGGRPIAHVLPILATGEAADDWDAAKDARRCELIDREIAGTITGGEAAELQALQAAMLWHRRKVAPLPLDDARRLHRELLAKAAGGPTA
ncbi:hypothetical protein GobsT_24450 [Gemmata obscuriglobus]|uniref:Uncharacterized protein n=2 Tax=Gemmata obscuriglobus TaxID=114 RepID=A0A2Z3H8D3_9BACT|nr:hypothetical protein C1280_21215 [Gemmata obscuriglobus]QEG27686.1 hypothetical protein GobsT_24450 [Gemmata obscuriglobus]VTS04897.1 Uncharacterized protein OS=Candidatus Entotheonella sp. TSY2 GN=ETSY2_26460 PE=4 SV=1 [Gemmata obscuriglobus UQM 2246]